MNDKTRQEKKDILSIKIVGNRAVNQYDQRALSHSNGFETDQYQDRNCDNYDDPDNFSDTMR